VLDWAEPYDVGNSREILGSFMEGKPMVCTVFEKDTDHAKRRLWHLLLLGDRGCIVWWSEDVIDWTKPDLPLTDKAKALAPVLKEMQSPLAKLFILAKREWDPIAIHYSQPSIQVAWLLESCADGKTWPRRFSSYESTHNQHAQVRNSWLKLLQDLGYSPRFVSSDELMSKDRSKASTRRALVFPQAWSVSDQERSHLYATSTIYSSLPRGLFDEHSKHRAVPASRVVGQPEFSLSIENEPQDNGAIFTTEGLQSSDGIDRYAAERLSSSKTGGSTSSYQLPKYATENSQKRTVSDLDRTAISTIADNLRKQGINPPIRIPAESRVRTHRFTLGKARLLAFERNIDYKMSEDLAQAGGNEQLEKPVTFTASWNGDQEVYDLRTGKHLGRSSQIEVNLDPWQPSLYALLPATVEGDVVQALLTAAPPFAK
jgi:hypothetical protein